MYQTIKNLTHEQSTLRHIVFVITISLAGLNSNHAQQNKHDSSISSLDQNQEFYYEPEVFGINEIVKDDYVVDIEVGEDGKIYWANRRQILVYEKGIFTEVFNLSGYKRVKQLYYDGKSRLWITFIHSAGDPIDETIIILDSNDFSKIPLDKVNISNLNILEKTGIRSIIKDKNGVMYILNDKVKMLVLLNEELVPAKSNINFKDGIILDLDNWSHNNSNLSYKDENYLITSSHYSNSEDVSVFVDLKRKNEINNGISIPRIDRTLANRFGANFKLKMHDRNTLILNTEKEISILNLKEDKVLKVDEEIAEIFADRYIINVQIIKNDLWVGTNKGLIKITKKHRDFKYLLGKQSISVRNILDIGNDSILIAHENGISLYDASKKTIKTRVNNIAAYGMVQNGNDIIFNTYASSIFISNFRNTENWDKIILEEQALNTKYVKNIYNLGSGNLLVLKSNNIALYNYKNEKSQNLKNENCPIEDYYSILNIDNELILTGDKGACTLDLDKMSFTKDTRYPTLKISHIYKPTDSIAWIGTKEEGLLKKNLISGSIDTFNIDDGLLSLNVHSAFLDSHKRLWASTDYGISVLDVNTSDIVTLTSDEGIHENEMNIHSFLTLPDSSLMYGTVDGVIHFSPNDIDLSFAREELNIESLTYTNTRTNKEANVIYKKFPESITVESYYANSRIKISSRFKNKSNNIRYLISNSESNNWQILKEDHLDFSQLEASKNTILLSYRIGLNEWSSPKIIEVIKKQPLLLRPSFYLTCLSALILLMLLRTLLLQRNTSRRNIEIQHKVNVQTNELSKKIIELSKSNELNEKLFSIIGHDLKSPLSSLLNLNKSINHLIQNKEYPNLEKLGNTVETNSRNALEVVNRLLDWASSLKDTSIVKTNIDIESIFNVVINDLQEQLQSKNINIIFRIEKKTFYSEKESLTIIIRNLIQNAIKYSYSKSDIILASRIEKNNIIAVSVIDHGIGINNSMIGILKHQDKAYSRTGTNREKGLGLGLSICLELSKRIGGKIQIGKNNTKGSIFTLLIDPSSQVLS